MYFVFENFGKTPGIIREVRGDLFLCEMDQFPIVDLGRLPVIDYQPIVAGESRRNNSKMGVAEYEKTMTLTQTEYMELLSPDKTKCRRLVFIGSVIYDDFFDSRHTRRFCVKLMHPREGKIFQLVRGGKSHNHVDREKIPHKDYPIG